MAHLQVQYEPAIRDFKTKLKQYTIQAQCGRPYVLVWQLTNWLKSKRPETETTQTRILLRAAYYRNQPKIIFLPPETYQIQAEETCCLIIFSILLQLDLGHLVDHFQRWGQFDVHLPIDRSLLQQKFKNVSVSNAPKLAMRFDEMQWRFCPVILELGMSWEFGRDRVIPICGKEEINTKGGTEKLWQIKVQEEFVGPKLRNAALSAKFSDKEFGNVSPRPASSTPS